MEEETVICKQEEGSSQKKKSTKNPLSLALLEVDAIDFPCGYRLVSLMSPPNLSERFPGGNQTFV